MAIQAKVPTKASLYRVKMYFRILRSSFAVTFLVGQLAIGIFETNRPPSTHRKT